MGCEACLVIVIVLFGIQILITRAWILQRGPVRDEVRETLTHSSPQRNSSDADNFVSP
jgi:hypothetical protein